MSDGINLTGFNEVKPAVQHTIGEQYAADPSAAFPADTPRSWPCPPAAGRPGRPPRRPAAPGSSRPGPDPAALRWQSVPACPPGPPGPGGGRRAAGRRATGGGWRPASAAAGF